jgi:hypothetical protein
VGLPDHQRQHNRSVAQSILPLPGIALEDAVLASRTRDWMDAGMGFADTLHPPKVRVCNFFVTFSHHFARAAKTMTCRHWPRGGTGYEHSVQRR